MKWVPVRGNRRQLPQEKRSASRLVMSASAVFLEARQEATCMHLPSERLDAGSSRPWPQSAAPEAPTAGAATGQSYLRDGVKTLRPSQAGV